MWAGLGPGSPRGHGRCLRATPSSVTSGENNLRGAAWGSLGVLVTSEFRGGKSVVTRASVREVPSPGEPGAGASVPVCYRNSRAEAAGVEGQPRREGAGVGVQRWPVSGSCERSMTLKVGFNWDVVCSRWSR